MSRTDDGAIGLAEQCERPLGTMPRVERGEKDPLPLPEAERAPEVSGVFSQGRTREEARANVIDALRLMLSAEPASQDDRREREPLHLTIGA